MALQLSGYQNLPLARALWIIFAIALLQWVIRHEMTRETWNKSKVWVTQVSRMVSFAAFIGCGAGIGAIAGLLLWLIIKAPVQAQPGPAQSTAQQQDTKPEEKKTGKEAEKGNDKKKDSAAADSKKKSDKPESLVQESHGDNSPNVATFGDNSPATVTINPEKSPLTSVQTYDFGGARRSDEPGHTRVVAGEETNVFQELVHLQTATDWKGLREASEAQIKKTPEWLTPYLFAGVAYLHLGDKEKAIERLTYVSKKAGGNSAYADADRILNQLQPKN